MNSLGNLFNHHHFSKDATTSSSGSRRHNELPSTFEVNFADLNSQYYKFGSPASMSLAEGIFSIDRLATLSNPGIPSIAEQLGHHSQQCHAPHHYCTLPPSPHLSEPPLQHPHHHELGDGGARFSDHFTHLGVPGPIENSTEVEWPSAITRPAFHLKLDDNCFPHLKLEADLLQ